MKIQLNVQLTSFLCIKDNKLYIERDLYKYLQVTSFKIAAILVEQIIFRYGLPRKLIKDRGTDFQSDIIKNVTYICNIHKLNTTPYHLQTDRMIEIFNQD